MNYTDNRFASASELKAELFDQSTTAAIRSGNWEHRHTVLHPDGIKTHFAFHHLAPPRTWAANYKSRMEGAIKVTQQEQVEEASSRTQAKATDLYHFGRMRSLNDINCMIGIFFCLMNTIIEYDANSRPAVWLEIVEFDTTMRRSPKKRATGSTTTETSKNWCLTWFKKLRQTSLDLLQSQEIPNTKSNRRRSTNPPWHLQIRKRTRYQPPIRTRSIILTIQADRYSTAALVFKLFQPPETKKRQAQNETGTKSPTNKSKANNGTANGRIPRNASTGTQNSRGLITNIPAAPGLPGKKIFKNLSTDDKMLHPGPIFPHQTRPNKFTLLCCRASYDGKTCTYNPCNSFHFPETLNNSVSNEIKTKMVSWVKTQPLVEWLPEAEAWARPQGNSTSASNVYM